MLRWIDALLTLVMTAVMAWFAYRRHVGPAFVMIAVTSLYWSILRSWFHGVVVGIVIAIGPEDQAAAMLRPKLMLKPISALARELDHGELWFLDTDTKSSELVIPVILRAYELEIRDAADRDDIMHILACLGGLAGHLHLMDRIDFHRACELYMPLRPSIFAPLIGEVLMVQSQHQPGFRRAEELHLAGQKLKSARYQSELFRSNEEDEKGWHARRLNLDLSSVLPGSINRSDLMHAYAFAFESTHDVDLLAGAVVLLDVSPSDDLFYDLLRHVRCRTKSTEDRARIGRLLSLCSIPVKDPARKRSMEAAGQEFLGKDVVRLPSNGDTEAQEEEGQKVSSEGEAAEAALDQGEAPRADAGDAAKGPKEEGVQAQEHQEEELGQA